MAWAGLVRMNRNSSSIALAFAALAHPARRDTCSPGPALGADHASSPATSTTRKNPYRQDARAPTIEEEADCIAGSPLRRSVESAQVLAPGVAPVIDPQFQEVYLPTSVRSRLRLPPKIWVFGLRTAWYCGWSPGVESHAAARRRAAAATASLVALTAAHPRILLIAHGVMNGLIAAQLRRGGWRGPWVRPRRYWAFAVYERPE